MKATNSTVFMVEKQCEGERKCTVLLPKAKQKSGFAARNCTVFSLKEWRAKPEEFGVAFGVEEGRALNRRIQANSIQSHANSSRIQTKYHGMAMCDASRNSKCKMRVDC